MKYLYGNKCKKSFCGKKRSKGAVITFHHDEAVVLCEGKLLKSLGVG